MLSKGEVFFLSGGLSVLLFPVVSLGDAAGQSGARDSESGAETRARELLLPVGIAGEAGSRFSTSWRRVFRRRRRARAWRSHTQKNEFDSFSTPLPPRISDLSSCIRPRGCVSKARSNCLRSKLDQKRV